MRVYFSPSYPERAPSTRMRVHKVANHLRLMGKEVEIIPVGLSPEHKHALLRDIQPEDILYVQKWRTEFNAPDHIGTYKGKCKIVFDMDDRTEDEAVQGLIHISDALVVGNHYLYNLYHKDRPTFIVPSPVDFMEYPKPQPKREKAMAIAKCGIKPTLRRLGRIKDMLKQLKAEVEYKMVMAGFSNSTEVKEVRELLSFVKCTCMRLKSYKEYLAEVVPELQKCTIGIVPFKERDQGKSGHSVLANLAMGLPTITSPYAECDHIIQDGENGFLADTEEEWLKKTKELLTSEQLRIKFRNNGWRTILERYDVPPVAELLWKNLESI